MNMGNATRKEGHRLSGCVWMSSVSANRCVCRFLICAAVIGRHQNRRHRRGRKLLCDRRVGRHGCERLCARRLVPVVQADRADCCDRSCNLDDLRKSYCVDAAWIVRVVRSIAGAC